jgi:TRAP-type mannitol/chloroaromatic compound transport system permease small subunit
MQILLGYCRIVDAINERIGWAVRWLILVAVLIGAGNAIVRYVLSTSSNAWLEIQWYLFSAVFLLCAGYTLLRNEHIRIDIIQGNMNPRAQAWLDVFGTVFFLLPMALLILWLSWPVFVDSWTIGEMSGDAGGLVRWPVKLLIPVGFLFLILQALSELIKRIAFLMGLIPNPVPRGLSHGLPADELEPSK